MTDNNQNKPENPPGNDDQNKPQHTPQDRLSDAQDSLNQESEVAASLQQQTARQVQQLEQDNAQAEKQLSESAQQKESSAIKPSSTATDTSAAQPPAKNTSASHISSPQNAVDEGVSPQTLAVQDALPHTTVAHQVTPEISSESVPAYTDWISLYDAAMANDARDDIQRISPLVRSSLTYVVLEQELKLKNKRRILFLNNSDLLYGSVAGKCVFLPINWAQDFANKVMVHGGKITWETTFEELLHTHPNALQNLFSNNELWAEGEYPVLA